MLLPRQQWTDRIVIKSIDIQMFGAENACFGFVTWNCMVKIVSLRTTHYLNSHTYQHVKPSLRGQMTFLSHVSILSPYHSLPVSKLLALVLPHVWHLLFPPSSAPPLSSSSFLGSVCLPLLPSFPWSSGGRVCVCMREIEFQQSKFLCRRVFFWLLILHH